MKLSGPKPTHTTLDSATPAPKKGSLCAPNLPVGEDLGLYNRLEVFSQNVEEGLQDLLNHGLGRPEVKRGIEKTIVEAEALAMGLSEHRFGREAIRAGLYSAGRGEAAEGIGVLQDAMQYGLRPEVEAAARKALGMLQAISSRGHDLHEHP